MAPAPGAHRAADRCSCVDLSGLGHPVTAPGAGLRYAVQPGFTARCRSTSMSFKNIRPGDRIQFRGAVGGCVQRRHGATVTQALEDHVVVEHGTLGTVRVDVRNFMCAEPRLTPRRSVALGSRTWRPRSKAVTSIKASRTS